jgi:hypothetical protein
MAVSGYQRYLPSLRNSLWRVALHHEVLPGIQLRARRSATARLSTRLGDHGEFDKGIYKAEHGVDGSVGY